jgi:hypothetical protein
MREISPAGDGRPPAGATEVRVIMGLRSRARHESARWICARADGVAPGYPMRPVRGIRDVGLRPSALHEQRIRMTSPRFTSYVYALAARPDWGRAVIAHQLADRTRYVFEHAGERTFMNEPQRLHEVEIDEGEREILVKTLLRGRSAIVRKRAPISGAKGGSQMTFEAQEEAFAARFPQGFEDPKYVKDERGGGSDPRLDAMIELARTLFTAQRLDDAIARGAFAEVHADGAKLIAAARRLALPKADRPMYERMLPADHERFALALRALLYGEGLYPQRFSAFVKALGGKGVSWSIATLFSAAVYPEAHVFVKPTTSQRQAKALGLSEVPTGAVSGAAYAKHMAVANALKERLVGAGRTPRDLFDVCTYTWRTMSKSTTPAAPPPSED